MSFTLCSCSASFQICVFYPLQNVAYLVMAVPDAQIWHLEMEPKYLMKTDIQLNPDISRMENDKKILQKAAE